MQKNGIDISNPGKILFPKSGFSKQDVVDFYTRIADHLIPQKDTGNLLWEHGRASAQTVPLVDDDHVYYTSRVDDTVVALTHNGEEYWSTK